MEVEKSLIFLQSLWSDDIEIETTEVFQSTYLDDTDQKVANFDQLRNWLKVGVDVRLLINFFQPAT